MLKCLAYRFRAAAPTFYASLGIRQKTTSSLKDYLRPVVVKNDSDQNIGNELCGSLMKEDIVKQLAKFYQRPEIQGALYENGLDSHLFHETYLSFRKYCLDSKSLPADLHITLSDIIAGAAHVDNLVPYFLSHAKKAFPHLECIEDLKKISDLRVPASWYAEARRISRKVIFHAGPTNSGKTFQALDSYLKSKSGVYCGPLKLLAAEVFKKSNDRGVACDLVTGEERKFANPDQSPATHVACTVEMVSVNTPYEVAVIDEIQMLKDPARGWAWTRALLGIAANEIHLCGEIAAADLVKEILLSAGEELELRTYKRLTELVIQDKALNSLENIQEGDCIVCFNKQDIFSACQQIQAMGVECAVIYGSLPPGTKLSQAQKFNDPDHPCKVLVATDAIGMGLNLNIRRVIFNSLIKPSVNEKGEKEIELISSSQALQIAGRAGRFATKFSTGYVTTMKSDDLDVLKELLAKSPEPLQQAGLHPTAEQIELYAYHLPNATLSNLIDIFVHLSTLDDSLYFMCNIDDFKFLADMIQHIPLPLRARYVFCCAPINRKAPFVCSMFLKYARQYSRNESLTIDWVNSQVGWPLSVPRTMAELVHLEAVFDVLDLYLWLSYRFPDLFPDSVAVREMQGHLDEAIQQGVTELSQNRVSAHILQPLPVVGSPVAAPMVRHHKKISEQLSDTLSPEILKQLKEELREELLRENLNLKARRKIKQTKNKHSKL